MNNSKLTSASIILITLFTLCGGGEQIFAIPEGGGEQKTHNVVLGGGEQ